MSKSRISEIIAKSSKPCLSIEIFPPKTDEGVENLKARLESFKVFEPEFISVTYGAGGSTRSNTQKLAEFVQHEMGLTSMAHLTCVGQTAEELRRTLQELKKAGIKNIMALRGDPPGGGDQAFETVAGGLSHGNQLIEMVAKEGGFDIGCAGYPEGHVESRSWHQDVDFLKMKIDSGANFIVTQFFLENAFFYRYREYLYARGIRVPLIPGILPISNSNQVSKFAFMCGCTIPAKVMRGLFRKSDEDQENFGLDHAYEQVEDLLKNGVDGVHLYALNKRKAVERLAPLLRK